MEVSANAPSPSPAAASVITGAPTSCTSTRVKCAAGGHSIRHHQLPGPSLSRLGPGGQLAPPAVRVAPRPPSPPATRSQATTAPTPAVAERIVPAPGRQDPPLTSPSIVRHPVDFKPNTRDQLLIIVLNSFSYSRPTWNLAQPRRRCRLRWICATRKDSGQRGGHSDPRQDGDRGGKHPSQGLSAHRTAPRKPQGGDPQRRRPQPTHSTTRK